MIYDYVAFVTHLPKFQGFWPRPPVVPHACLFLSPCMPVYMSGEA